MAAQINMLQENCEGTVRLLAVSVGKNISVMH